MFLYMNYLFLYINSSNLATVLNLCYNTIGKNKLQLIFKLPICKSLKKCMYDTTILRESS